MKNDWNLGSGKPNVIQSLKNKLDAAGYHLECTSKNGRTILNIDTYEHTILCWALEAYNQPKECGTEMEGFDNDQV